MCSVLSQLAQCARVVRALEDNVLAAEGRGLAIGDLGRSAVYSFINLLDKAKDASCMFIRSPGRR